MSKFWNFSEENDAVTLHIDGTIVDDDDQWMYDWLDMKSSAPKEFRDELAKYAGKTLNVWIDSYGGDVFAGVGLYDALMEHKKTGSKIVTKGEKVFSAATLPFMAGDDRLMAPGGIFMLHNPITEIQGYSKDLRKAADVLDVVKECIMNVYQTTVGIGRDELSELMENETHMSPQDAVKNKMATGILETSDKKVSNISKLAIMNAANISRSGIIKAIENFELPESGREEEKMEIKNVEDLRKAFPDLVNEIEAPVDKAVNEERQRIIDLDKLDDISNEALHKIINHAKETGQKAEDVQFYVDAVKDVVKPDVNQLKKIVEDSAASGVDGIKADPKKQITDEEKSKAFAENMAKEIKKIREAR